LLSEKRTSSKEGNLVPSLDLLGVLLALMLRFMEEIDYNAGFKKTDFIPKKLLNLFT
jgi:hypothetical protein